MERKRIAIVGVGLIGGSLAIQLHEKKLASKLIGVDANAAHAQQAVELELVDETMGLDEAIEQSDIIVLAIPVDTMLKIVPAILDKVDKQIVIDLGSTKSQLMELVKKSSQKGEICSHASDVGYRIQRTTGGSAWRL